MGAAVTEFVRENTLMVYGTFQAADGSDTQPATVEAVVTYTNLSGAKRTDVVSMTLGVDGIWRGYWDNSQSVGHVDWKVRGSGGVKGADAGWFTTKVDPTL